MSEIRHYRIAHRATIYDLTVVDDDGEDYLLLFATVASHHGEWLRIPVYIGEGPSLAWSYLTEKCPGLARFGGDREGWVKVLHEAGVEVF